MAKHDEDKDKDPDQDVEGTCTLSKTQMLKLKCKQNPWTTVTAVMCAIIFFMIIIVYIFYKMPGETDEKWSSLNPMSGRREGGRSASGGFSDIGRAPASDPMDAAPATGNPRYNRRFYY